MAMAMEREKRKPRSKPKDKDGINCGETQQRSGTVEHNTRRPGHNVNTEKNLRKHREEEERRWTAERQQKAQAAAVRANSRQNLPHNVASQAEGERPPGGMDKHIEMNSVVDLNSITNDPDAPPKLKQVFTTTDQSVQRFCEDVDKATGSGKTLSREESRNFLQRTKAQLAECSIAVDAALEALGDDGNGGNSEPPNNDPWWTRAMRWIRATISRLWTRLTKLASSDTDDQHKGIWERFNNWLRELLDKITGKKSSSNEPERTTNESADRV